MSDELEHGTPFFGDDGEYHGTLLQTDDGGWAVVADDGEIVAAIDSANELVDASEYALDGGEINFPDQRGAELHERIDAVARGLDEMNERSQRQIYQPTPDSEEQHVARMQAGRDQFEKRERRPMTMAEQRAFGHAYISAAERGDYIDVQELASEAKQHDLDKHQGRVDYAVARLSEDSEDVTTGQPYRRAVEYDTSTHEGRVDKAMDALAGHDTGPPPYDPDEDW